MSYTEDYKKAKEKGKTKQVTTEIFSWDQEGDTVIGKVLKIAVFEGGKWGAGAMQYTIATDKGIITTILGTACDKQLVKLDLIGKVVYIEYGGKINLEDGRQVNRFKVELL